MRPALGRWGGCLEQKIYWKVGGVYLASTTGALSVAAYKAKHTDMWQRQLHTKQSRRVCAP